MEKNSITDCLNEIDNSIVLGSNNIRLENVHNNFLQNYKELSLEKSNTLFKILNQLININVDVYENCDISTKDELIQSRQLVLDFIEIKEIEDKEM